MLAWTLKWLQANNPKYYGDIQINDSRLAMLPVDDVPEELLVNIHHETDMSIINIESDGYVPQDNMDRVEDGLGQGM